MIVYADLVEDFSQSLSEFQDVLSVKIPKNDTFYSVLVQDAQLFSFVRSSQVVRSLLMTIHKENDFEFFPAGTESALASLCMKEIIEEDDADQLLELLDVAEFFALDHAWLETEEDRRQFDGGICELPLYYRTLNHLLHDVSTKCDLIERQEETYEGH